MLIISGNQGVFKSPSENRQCLNDHIEVRMKRMMFFEANLKSSFKEVKRKVLNKFGKILPIDVM